MEQSPYVLATVSEWNGREGWGVVSADDVPEDIWVHFSVVDRFANLLLGERVEVDVDGPLAVEQEGYRYRARRVHTLY
jgi:cold shock protein